MFLLDSLPIWTILVTSEKWSVTSIPDIENSPIHKNTAILCEEVKVYLLKFPIPKL